MTAKKDLKRRIRERMDRTGEPYSVARRAVLAESDPLVEARALQPILMATPERSEIEVVEMDDVTELATELGMKCTISITHSLIAEVPARAVLERVRDVLLETGSDPGLEMMRGVILLGEEFRRPRRISEWYDDLHHFSARVRAGIGGVSDGGTMLAMHLHGTSGLVMMVVQLGFWLALPKGRPRVVLTTAEAAGFFVERIAARKLATR